MMQIFVKKPEGKTITLNVESNEKICSVKRRLEDKDGIHRHLQRLFYAGKLLEDGRVLTYYNVLRDSTLHLLLRPRKLPHIYVKNEKGKIITLRIVGLNTVEDVKAKIHEKEGILPLEQSLVFAGRQLHGNQTLLENHIGMESTLHLKRRLGGTKKNVKSRGTPIPPSRAYEQAHQRNAGMSPAAQVPSQQIKRTGPATQITPNIYEHQQSAPTQRTPPNVTSQGNPLPSARVYEQAHIHNPSKRPAALVPPRQIKRTCPAIQTTPSKRLSTQSGLSIGALTASIKAKLNDSALLQAKATAALSDPMPEICAHPPPLVLTELEDLKRELATSSSHSKEKELEATISGQTQKCASYENQIVSLKKKTEEELTVACNKEKELEATISGLYKVISTMCGSYESQLFALKAENKETQQELMIARNKEKEREATNSRLAHKNEVFSAQCASYESQIVALEAEIKTYREGMTVLLSRPNGISQSLDDARNGRQSGSNP